MGREHVERVLFPNTIMHAYGEGVPGHELHPLDREALNAVYYGVREGEYQYTADEFFVFDLGFWLEDTAYALGVFSVPGGEAAFGVASSIAGDRAWAYGPSPAVVLAENREIRGTARWEGMMIGITDEFDAIGAAADLSVDLSDLDGRLDFTQMRYLTDTSIVWGDGDLAYSIEVRGNTFIQSGGDRGIVTGAFFGEGHEGMGGSLERSDLTAAFGGIR